jgi:hypothetical protein
MLVAALLKAELPLHHAAFRQHVSLLRQPTAYDSLWVCLGKFADYLSVMQRSGCLRPLHAAQAGCCSDKPHKAVRDAFSFLTCSETLRGTRYGCLCAYHPTVPMRPVLPATLGD